MLDILRPNVDSIATCEAKEVKKRMKMKFYDVKTRMAVDAEVTERKEYTVKGKTRYAVRGKTADGRPLTKFVSKADYDKAA